MGEVISARAAVDSVEDHVRQSLMNAKARGDEVAEAAEGRLGSAVEAIDAAKQQLTAASEAENLAWANVLAEDDKSDKAIGAIRDNMWNAIDRQRQSPAMDHVFPGGVRTYTSGKAEEQPMRMSVLAARIRSASAPAWTPEKRQAWAAEVDALQTTYKKAVDDFQPVEAARVIAEAGYRSSVRTGQARLTSFKRDLKNLGLSETQIHAIIPDASKPPGKPDPSKQG